MKREVESWESRFEDKKKTLIELESIMTKKINELERTKAILGEKNNKLEEENLEMKETMKSEKNKIEIEFRNIRELTQKENKTVYGEIESLRKEKYELEITLAEMTAKYEKDKAVFESRIGFLDNQNKKLKSDLAESQSNFDSMYQKFHQFRVADKEESESTHNTFIFAIEDRYNSQLNDLREQNKVLIDTYKDKLKSLEREVKRLERSNQELINIRQGTCINHEKKINELSETANRLYEENIQMKREIEKSQFELTSAFDKEKILLRKKISDLENIIKKFELEKSILAMDFEKQKTRHHIEQDKLLSQKTELCENLERVHKKYDNLTRDNEKLKNEMKMLRRSNIKESLTFMNKTTNKSDIFSINQSDSSNKEFYLNDSRTTSNTPNQDS